MEQPYRIIHSLYLDFGRKLDGSSSGLDVPLHRSGKDYPNPRTTNGRPRDPKKRAIDLRPGDFVLCTGEWRAIAAVSAYRDGWLTEEQALNWPGDDGYIYRPKNRKAKSPAPIPPDPACSAEDQRRFDEIATKMAKPKRRARRRR